METRTITVGFAPPAGSPQSAGAGERKTIDVQVPPGLAPIWDLDAKLEVVGTDVRRLDGYEKVMGAAKYTYDINLPGMLYARILRSRLPAAIIKSVDTSEAEKMPGVKAVVLAFEKEKIGEKPVRFAGEELVAIAADTPERAEDAIRAVKIEYEAKPFVVDVDDARKPGAPVVHVGESSNVRVGGRRNKPSASREQAEAALSNAAKTVSNQYRTQVQTHTSLETHGVVVQPNPDGSLKVWASTQGVFSVRDGMADALGLAKDKVEVISHYVGGGFGAKFGPGKEGVLAAKLAQKANAPVKLMLNRKEEHLAVGNRPNSVQDVKLGATADGKLAGAVISTYGTPGVANGGAGCQIPIVYDLPKDSVFKEEADVNINAGPSAAMRAPGFPQGVFAMEQSVDQLAYELGMDPLEFRKKNDPSPVRLSQYETGAQEIGWQNRRSGKSTVASKTAVGGAETETPALPGGPIRRGIGMASTQWFNSGQKGSHADVEINKSGEVILMNGAQDIGTGFRTAMAIIVAEELGLKTEQITARIGESRYGYGAASGGSTTTPSVAPAVHAAAYNARMKLAEAVAAHWGVQPVDVVFEGGMVSPAAKLSAAPKPPEGADGDPESDPRKSAVLAAAAPNGLSVKSASGQGATVASTPAPGSVAPPEAVAAATPTDRMRPLTFKQACALLPADKITAGGDRPDNFAGYRDGVAGCQFAEVEVDTETGQVRVLKVVALQDSGRTLNPLTARSQIAGGVIQGVSYALFENRIMDRRVGCMVNANMLDYKIAGPADCPEIVVIITQVANGKNTVGVMGMAEAPNVPTAPAIANAIYDAIGVRITSLPITPDKILAALAQNSLKAGA